MVPAYGGEYSRKFQVELFCLVVVAYKGNCRLGSMQHAALFLYAHYAFGRAVVCLMNDIVWSVSEMAMVIKGSWIESELGSLVQTKRGMATT